MPVPRWARELQDSRRGLGDSRKPVVCFPITTFEDAVSPGAARESICRARGLSSCPRSPWPLNSRLLAREPPAPRKCLDSEIAGEGEARRKFSVTSSWPGVVEVGKNVNWRVKSTTIALGPAGFWRPKRKFLKSFFLCFDVLFARRKEGKWAKPLLKWP